MKSAHMAAKFLMGSALLALIWGCGSANSSAPSFMGGTHPVGWSTPAVHGTQYKAKPEQCTECHGKDFGGGTSKVSCYSCHSTFPHQAGWEAKHGPAYLANPGECKKCHGQDLSGGLTGVGCNAACHLTYQHPANWADPFLHGTAFGENPPACQPCHGYDYRGGVVQVSCINDPSSPQPTGCHPAPAAIHSATWDHSTAARLAPSAASPTDSFIACRNCHGFNFKGTPLSSNKDCFSANSCHFHPAGMPHSYWNGVSTGFVASHNANNTLGRPAVAVENAPVCYSCHNRVQGPHNWYNPEGTILTPIPNMLTPATGNPDPNAVPGCYNNTLCHGAM